MRPNKQYNPARVNSDGVSSGFLVAPQNSRLKFVRSSKRFCLPELSGVTFDLFFDRAKARVKACRINFCGTPGNLNEPLHTASENSGRFWSNKSANAAALAASSLSRSIEVLAKGLLTILRVSRFCSV